MIDKTIGLYGGRVLRSINVNGEKKCRGAELTADTTSGWPLKNRLALHSSSKVEFFNPGPGDHEPGDHSHSLEPELGDHDHSLSIAADPAYYKNLKKPELIELATSEKYNIDVTDMTAPQIRESIINVDKEKKGAE